MKRFSCLANHNLSAVCAPCYKQQIPNVIGLELAVIGLCQIIYSYSRQLRTFFLHTIRHDVSSALEIILINAMR